MKRAYGFTVIELVVVIAFALLASGLLLYQKANIEASQRDEARKTAINAMYYNLEVFFKQNSYYPDAIDDQVLTAMDPVLFTDPQGTKLGESASDYRYEATDCEGEKCKSYTLRSQLEKENDYVKSSRSN